MTNDVIQITAGDVSILAKTVGRAISNAIVTGGMDAGRFAQAVMSEAQNLANSKMQPVNIPGCGVSFSAAFIEYQEWAILAILMARSAEILRRKARDTHCYNHTKPCLIAKPIDEKVHQDCLDSFETLLRELEGAPT
jgi:hypothetical protein